MGSRVYSPRMHHRCKPPGYVAATKTTAPKGLDPPMKSKISKGSGSLEQVS